MFEEEIDIAALISLDVKGELNLEDRKVLDNWLIANPANRILFDDLMQQESVRAKMIRFNASNRSAVWNKVTNRLAKIPEDVIVVKKINLWPRIGIAAAAVVLLGLTLLYFDKFSIGQKQSVEYVNDISPGQIGATLTLANGKKIKLKDVNNGELAKEAGIRISKRANGQLVYEVTKPTEGQSNQLNILSTNKGETYMLILPDHSKVWMNAASSLTYTAGLQQNGIRRVKLEGEAYFEIAKDKLHPFIVESQGQEVEVLGTHFNISAYPDEKVIKTTLLEGSVKISADGMPKGEMLKPNQQAIASHGTIEIKNVIADSFVDWKNGVFSFEDESMQAIMRKVARWYNVDVIYDGTANDQQTFSGTISRSVNVSKVLETLTDISNMKFRIEERKIIVAK